MDGQLLDGCKIQSAVATSAVPLVRSILPGSRIGGDRFGATVLCCVLAQDFQVVHVQCMKEGAIEDTKTGQWGEDGQDLNRSMKLLH